MPNIILHELTGQESGIVLYDENVIVCNWTQECTYGGLPLLGPIGGIIAWPEEVDTPPRGFT